MFKYRIINNMNPKENVLVRAKNKNNALSIGASYLKTTNVRAIRLKK